MKFMKFMDVTEASRLWGITDRRIRYLCNEGRIDGAIKTGWSWTIPSDAPKPRDGRTLRHYKNLDIRPGGIDVEKLSGLKKSLPLSEETKTLPFYRSIITETFLFLMDREGIQLGKKDVEAVYDGKLVSSLSLETHLIAINFRSAMLSLVTNAEPWTDKDIRVLYKSLMQGIDDISSMKWREGYAEHEVRGKEKLPVDVQMETLFTQYESWKGMNSLVTGVMLFGELLRIRPFERYSSLLSYLVAAGEMLRAGILPPMLKRGEATTGISLSSWRCMCIPLTGRQAMYDWMIRNATICDGTGMKPFLGDVAVFSGVVCLVAPAGSSIGARHVIDGTGLILSPGFIDIHTHDDLELLRNPGMPTKLMQGITTDVNGNCGIGLFPVRKSPESLLALNEDVLGSMEGEICWSDFDGYERELAKKGTGINVLFLSAHSALRIAAMGDDYARAATAEEIKVMTDLLSAQLDMGSIGFSSGLYYSPCLFADRRELDAIMGVLRERDAMFAVHHRCEGDDFISSLREVIDLAERNEVTIEVSHLKVIGKRNQEYMDEGIRLIEDARRRGVDIKFDQYPYEYGSTSLFSLLPPDIQKLSRLEQRLAVSLENEREDIKREMESPEGWDSIYSLVGPENLRMLSLDNQRQYEGRLLSEIAETEGKEPLDALLDILADEPGKALMTDVTQTEENLIKVMKHPLMGFGTDSLFSSPVPHPRTRDAAMHLIREYVTRKKVMPIEKAVRKMTGENADRLFLRDRGYIKEGFRADMTLFDAEAGRVVFTMVNGHMAYRDGHFSEELRGEVLRRKR